MSNFEVKIKSTFSQNGTKFEKGMEVKLNSKQTSTSNLLSAGRQDIIDAYKRNYGIEPSISNINSSYFEVKIV